LQAIEGIGLEGIGSVTGSKLAKIELESITKSNRAMVE
jgi:hypothetical protein